MKADCECRYCKNGVNEYFCITCGYNFNECESFFYCNGLVFCPKCRPKKEKCDRDDAEKLKQ